MFCCICGIHTEEAFRFCPYCGCLLNKEMKKDQNAVEPSGILLGTTSIFNAIQIGLASPEKIREWSRGEVKKPETINYRTLKPEQDGLFCERIFGPTRDWECHCGKYMRVRYKGIVCDRCGVEVTRAKVRRERMGHIELAAPVSHIWYFKGIPSRMCLLMDMSSRALEKVLYFASYVVTDPGTTPLSKKQILNEKEFRESQEKFGVHFRAVMGAEAIKELLAGIDMDSLSKELRDEVETTSGQKKIRAIKRLEVVEAFRFSDNRPEWMVLDVVPVIPPEIRPMVQLDGGRFATSDLNDLYRRVINRNNRLKRLLDLGAPEIIVRNEKRMLQEAVDALIDNGRRGRPVTGPGNRPLKSLSDMIKGIHGCFRQNLLGKRVNYSGRSVIVVGPELKLYQCGLPKEMALELFKPFVMKKLVERNLSDNIKSAKRMVEHGQIEAWSVLEEVIKDHPVLLNRAPTLHRHSIQAFEPVLIEGRAIQLHPLVCTAFNADFDGDTIRVHVPLTQEAQAEARILMLSANNLLNPQNGNPIIVPNQDIVLGSYYLTLVKETIRDSESKLLKEEKGEGKVFSSPDEALMAYATGAVTLHARIRVRITRKVDGANKSKIIPTTVGKIIFNQAIPQNLGLVDRSNPKEAFNYEVDFIVNKKELGVIIDKCIKVNGTNKTAEVLDLIKAQGFKYATRSAITIGISDMVIPEVKQRYLEKTDRKVNEIEKHFINGLYNRGERKRAIITAWSKTTEDVKNALIKSLDKFNPVFMMSDSGARGNINQIRQLAGMRGLMTDTFGETIAIPIRSNFREGLNLHEYFISTYGTRKGMIETILRTADSGYLTHRLVDISQDVIVRHIDCGTKEGIRIKPVMASGKIIEDVAERLTGRYAAEDFIHPQTGDLLVKANELMDEAIAMRVQESGLERIIIRSILNCRAKIGVCAKCYGIDLATGEPCTVGEAVGFIAAQSIGELGTQLSMRSFHTGGVGEDITQGLPRVEELFEARKPKRLAIISEIAGMVQIKETKKNREIVVTNNWNGYAHTYLIPYGSSIKVTDGEFIDVGDALTEGSINPHDILKVKGILAVQNYLVQEVQKVYRLHGVDINDKHIEVIVRQMLRKVKIDEAMDTDMLPGTLVDMFEFIRKNLSVEQQGLRPATGMRSLLGITKASLASESFLSAASFQETTRVLTESAIKGKIDPLLGIKENIIIGKLIPAGTGMPKYCNIELDIVSGKQHLPVIPARHFIIDESEYPDD